jgi:HK97 family phage portal protein
VPPAVLEHPLRLNSAQATELQTQWADSVARARSVPAVLSGGIKFSPLTVTPRDVQLIESRQWNATAIATLLGLPPYLLGGSTGDSLTYSTVEGENTRLWTNALQPMCVRLERAIGGAWTPAGQRLRFVPDALLRSQTLDRYQAHRIALGDGVAFATVDEIRSLENRGPMPDAPPEPAPEPEE